MVKANCKHAIRINVVQEYPESSDIQYSRAVNKSVEVLMALIFLNQMSESNLRPNSGGASCIPIKAVLLRIIRNKNSITTNSNNIRRNNYLNAYITVLYKRRLTHNAFLKIK